MRINFMFAFFLLLFFLLLTEKLADVDGIKLLMTLALFFGEYTLMGQMMK